MHKVPVKKKKRALKHLKARKSDKVKLFFAQVFCLLNNFDLPIEKNNTIIEAFEFKNQPEK